MEQSADAGYLIAQLMYASDSRAVLGSRADMLRSPEDTIRYRRKAIAYLERAANTGNVDALISLGKSYQSGIIAKEDLVKAYSYFYAAGMVNPNFTRNYIGRLERKLTREQMEQAKQRGVQIFNGCCK
ncbi:hypothetical protein DX914_03470 [Lysobacter silvisoli]|uniref:Sel1 repeat family protein n=1 Tax=Lysobacter silvisoli TaxID=2293254 RepID=A0A371K2V3_9GAMM|nr:hypothetical protein DX914_03470 [Lysobacter silvisoli]